jgi:hypothetical protein
VISDRLVLPWHTSTVQGPAIGPHMDRARAHEVRGNLLDSSASANVKLRALASEAHEPSDAPRSRDITAIERGDHSKAPRPQSRVERYATPRRCNDVMRHTLKPTAETHRAKFAATYPRGVNARPRQSCSACCRSSAPAVSHCATRSAREPDDLPHAASSRRESGWGYRAGAFVARSSSSEGTVSSAARELEQFTCREREASILARQQPGTASLSATAPPKAARNGDHEGGANGRARGP